MLRTLILVDPPFIFMKRSKTSDPKPISLYRALTRPLQIHAPPRRTHETGARRSDAAWTSLKTDSPWDEAGPKVDKLASAPEFWAVVVELEAPPYTKPAPLEEVVVVTAVAGAVAVDVCSVVPPDAVEVTVEAAIVDVVVPPMVVVAVVVLVAVFVSVTVALDTVFVTVAELSVTVVVDSVVRLDTLLETVAELSVGDSVVVVELGVESEELVVVIAA